MLVAVPPSLPAATPSHRLFVSGDSLAVGTRPYMPGALPGWQIRTSASVSRHAADGAGVLAASVPLPRVIAVSLGTNDDPRFTSQFRQAIAATLRVAGPKRCVVWANIVRPPLAGTSYAGLNAVLRNEAKRHRNLRIVDWVSLVGAHPGWLGPDGVHVSAAGYRERARAFGREIRRCR